MRDRRCTGAAVFAVFLAVTAWAALAGADDTGICGYEEKGALTFERAGATVCRFRIAIAATPEQRSRGLMNCRDLPPGSGLLFLFAGIGERSFWMKDTPVPLAIVFLDAKDRVAAVEMGVPYSRESIPSGRPVGHVLEVNAREAACLAVGDRARWDLR